MKKIFTLACAALCALSASAQDVKKKAINLDKTYVMYMTNDTITTQKTFGEDPDTGEEVEVEAPKYWRGSDMVNAFNLCGMPLTGTSTTEIQTKITTRKNYKDEKTGFEMPAGSYRGVFVDGTVGFQGAVGTNNIVGYSNLKSVVMYFVPIPTTFDNMTPGKPALWVQDYPTGRVQARYVDAEGNALSVQGYREIHINMTDDPNYVNETVGPNTNTHNVRGTKLLNFTRAENDYFDITIDQPYKIEVNLQNKLDGSAYDGTWESDTKRSEYANFICGDETTEGEFSYYLADPTTTRPFADNPDNWSSCATGYDCVDKKWGKKVNWSPETIVNLEIKKRLYLVGVAFVSATEGAPSIFMNAADNFNAAWSESAKAAGHYADPTGIDSIATDKAQSSNAQAYNLAGQAVGAGYKGIVVKGNKKFIQR